MSHSVTCFQCRKAGFLKCVDSDMNIHEPSDCCVGVCACVSKLPNAQTSARFAHGWKHPHIANVLCSRTTRSVYSESRMVKQDR